MKDLILEYQNKWANGIIEIGKTKNDFEESSSVTTKFINELYDFQNGNVQFKPTKASINQFRNDFDSALSYFIGNNPNFSEDSGFALNPWVNVEFKNESINVYGDIGIAMGNYFFTDENGDILFYKVATSSDSSEDESKYDGIKNIIMNHIYNIKMHKVQEHLQLNYLIL